MTRRTEKETMKSLLTSNPTRFVPVGSALEAELARRARTATNSISAAVYTQAAARVRAVSEPF